jgi:uroporphyrinogen decarboxylase
MKQAFILQEINMNTRERFNALMAFEPVDRTLNWEFAYWVNVVRKWYAEGLPEIEGVPESLTGSQILHGPALFSPDGTSLGGLDSYPIAKDVNNYFNFDKEIIRVPLNLWVDPPFDTEIIEEDERTTLMRDHWGVKELVKKDASCAPAYIEWPVKNRADWEKLKEDRFQPGIETRITQDYSKLIKEFDKRDFPLVIGGYPFGFYGGLRFLFGEQNLSYMFYDDPQLIKDIQGHLTDLWISLFTEVLKDVTPDFCLLWEDMAYRSGSMISPIFFKEFLSPYYKRLTDFLVSQGVKNIFVDCDGNTWELLPLWIEAGITGTYPLEVNAGMDVVKVREQFPKFQMMGGVDKLQLMMGKSEIDIELNRLPCVIKQGGYVPHVDHSVPYGVPWENFKYYREELLKIIDRTPVLS